VPKGHSTAIVRFLISYWSCYTDWAVRNATC